MNISFCTWGFALTIISISCNNAHVENNTEIPEKYNADTTPITINEISAIDRDSFIKNLQGEWKEIQYPFRVVYFKDTTVKFIEEGVVEAPKFKKYKISKQCPYEVNNITNAALNDIFLVMVEAKACEILTISKDSLTLSGFNVNTNNDYKIIYKKVE